MSVSAKARAHAKDKLSKGFIRYKLHRQGADTVLAAADEEALGVRHEGAGRVLDLVRFRSFYDGERAEPSCLGALFGQCTSANLVGRRAVDSALDAGVVEAAQVVLIGNTPHVQIYDLSKK